MRRLVEQREINSTCSVVDSRSNDSDKHVRIQRSKAERSMYFSLLFRNVSVHSRATNEMVQCTFAMCTAWTLRSQGGEDLRLMRRRVLELRQRIEYKASSQ